MKQVLVCHCYRQVSTDSLYLPNLIAIGKVVLEKKINKCC